MNISQEIAHKISQIQTALDSREKETLEQELNILLLHRAGL